MFSPEIMDFVPKLQRIDAVERVRIATKLFASFAPRKDAEASMDAWIDGTKDLPVGGLRCGGRLLLNDSDRQGSEFMCSVPEMRRYVALAHTLGARHNGYRIPEDWSLTGPRAVRVGRSLLQGTLLSNTRVIARLERFELDECRRLRVGLVRLSATQDAEWRRMMIEQGAAHDRVGRGDDAVRQMLGESAPVIDTGTVAGDERPRDLGRRSGAGDLGRVPAGEVLDEIVDIGGGVL